MDKSRLPSERELILDELKPMFEEARSKGLWFYSYYQSMWFSPDELEAHHKQNRFIWGKKNWKLRDPSELVETYRQTVVRCINEYRNIKARVA